MDSPHVLGLWTNVWDMAGLLPILLPEIITIVVCVKALG